MFAKRFLQKTTHQSQTNEPRGTMLTDLDLQIAIHYGVPTTASILAFDPIQSLLAIGTLDGRIKVAGGDNIEAILISPKESPCKYLEFLQNQGLLVSISNDNDVQVWSLERRCIAASLQWESNITAFSVIYASHFMYIGDEHGMLSVLKYETDGAQLLQLPYHITWDHLTKACGFSVPNHQPIVGVLPQPCSSWKRVLIAYASGLFAVWDVVEAQIVVVKGDKVLQLKDGVVDSHTEVHMHPDAAGQHMEVKEIGALCWASSNGSILAVGYIDGDILFWKTSNTAIIKGKKAELSCSNVVKLQLSSAARRLPVIVLHWSAKSKSHNDYDGQLFIYGGCEIGSEEVLVVLNLEWSSGMETLKCVGRVDITLNGSFADMILLTSAGTIENNHNAGLFVLTNPGRVHFFDDIRLSASSSQQVNRIPDFSVEFLEVVPTADLQITAVKLSILPSVGKLSQAQSKISSLMKRGSTRISAGGTKWPLTGGVCSQPLITGEDRVETVYVAGYEDGSIWIWDATDPVLSLICILESKVEGIKIAGSNAPVSKIDFCSVTLSLAIGNGCGLVRLYNFSSSLDETSFHLVTEAKHEVLNLPRGKGYCIQAVFCLLDSPVQALQFTSCGTKLAVGYDCGRLAVLDMRSLSVLYLTDSVSGSSSTVVQLVWKSFLDSYGHVKSPKNTGSNIPKNSTQDLIFILTKDAKVYVKDADTGTLINSRPMHLKNQSRAISMYVIEDKVAVTDLSKKKRLQQLAKDPATMTELAQDTTSSRSEHETENQTSENASSSNGSKYSYILLCCEETLRLYHTKTVVKGEKKSVRKMKLAKRCCWTTIIRKDEEVCDLLLLYQTGHIEIRSLPDLELVKESSLWSILRWNFKANMENTISSTDNGLITLVNGCELAFISLLACESNFRIPESLPSLHDKVLAAAADAAISFSFNQKKKQGTGSGILGGILKGFKGEKVNHTNDIAFNSKSNYSHLEDIFSRNPFPELSSTITENQEVLELDIDDIEIDDPLPFASTSTDTQQKNQKDKHSEREKLLDGAGDDIKPRLRTPEEIMAAYRKAGDASSAAGQARNKLLERQEKLERISKRTEDLRNGAEDFASLANELVKAMENRKWWQV